MLQCGFAMEGLKIDNHSRLTEVMRIAEETSGRDLPYAEQQHWRIVQYLDQKVV